MHNVTTSRHIRTSSELMIMVPIKKDFVPITDLVMTYSSRISVVLQALSEIRQLKVERGFDDPIGPIERLQTIYRVQWTVIEPFDDVTTSKSSVARQMHGPQVVLTSHFDSSWEAYFQALVTTGGPLLDLIFSHCDDYVGFSCLDGFDAFARFIRRHQRRCDFLYATAPEVTIDDVRYFTRYASGMQGGAAGSLPPSVPSVIREASAINRWQARTVAHDERTRAALRTIHALHDIRERLFLDTGGLGDRSDRELYDDAVASTLVTEPELFRLGAVLRRQQAHHELERARAWLERIVPKPTPEPLAPLEEATKNEPTCPLQPNQIDELLGDIQGNILNSNVLNHGALPQCARLVLVRCSDAAGLRELLKWAKAKVPSEQAIRAGTTRVHVNLGITHYGIELLQLPKAIIEGFPREFREGMEERAGLLGDVAHNHPRNWKLPLLPNEQERAHLSTVHVALVMQGNTADVASLLSELASELAEHDGDVVHTLELKHSGQPELSQPIPPLPLRPAPQLQHAYSPLDVRTLGEFLLGYKPGEHELSKDLLKNGCFMAMRKMAIRKVSENKTALDAYIEDVARQIKGNEALSPEDDAQLVQDVSALVMGRKTNGQMLGTLQPQPTVAANAFDFSKDPEGKSCPLGSHIRRSNPRATNTPRIARRGIPYQQAAAGPEPREDGLLFMAYCASLSAQYEIVQRWVNGGNASGLLSRHNDPLCGAPVEHSVPRVVSLEGTIAANIPGAPKLITLHLPVEPFVTLRWGMYLFMPSLSALGKLQQTFPADENKLLEQSIARGNERLQELDALSPALRTHELRRLLEEVPEADSPQALHARDVAAAITGAGGARRFVGEHRVDVVVVTKAALARQVLGESKLFSVCKYRERMKLALRDHYLGYDLCSQDDATKLSYEQLATAANQAIKDLDERALKKRDAYKIAKKLLRAPDTLQLDPDGTGPDGTPRHTISVRDLAEAVIGELCHKWLDMPGKGRATASKPDDVENTRGWMGAVQRLLIASRYCFQAFPVPFLAQQAANNQSDLVADYEHAGQLQSCLAEVVQKHHPTLASSEIKRLTTTVLLGAVGFAPPAVGAITRILDHWIESESLWQIQRNVQARPDDLKPVIRSALSKVPAPPTLYRTALSATKLGEADVPADALVVVNLAAVYEDAYAAGDNRPEAWFFGGVHGGAAGNGTQHGCPGQEAGMHAIEQIIRAVLECKNIRRERRMLLSYDR